MDGASSALPVAPWRATRNCSALMRTLIHLSDLHFGRVDPAILRPLLQFINITRPDLVAISGDLTGKNGRIKRQQLRELWRRFAALSPAHVKIVVTHHPFDLPPGVEGDRVVGRSRLAMKVLAEIRADMLLAGHFHIGGTSQTTA